MSNEQFTMVRDIRGGMRNINIKFIVMDIGHATVTKDNRAVHNFKVGDPSGCINVSIWDEPGKHVKPGDIIKMTNAYTAIWCNCLTLYSGKLSSVNKIGEFCMVFNESVNMSEPTLLEPYNASDTGHETTTHSTDISDGVVKEQTRSNYRPYKLRNCNRSRRESTNVRKSSNGNEVN